MNNNTEYPLHTMPLMVMIPLEEYDKLRNLANIGAVTDAKLQEKQMAGYINGMEAAMHVFYLYQGDGFIRTLKANIDMAAEVRKDLIDEMNEAKKETEEN